MAVGAFAISAVLATQSLVEGDRIGLGHVVGWLIGGALVGLGVQWLIDRRAKT